MPRGVRTLLRYSSYDNVFEIFKEDYKRTLKIGHKVFAEDKVWVIKEIVPSANRGKVGLVVDEV